MFGLSMGTTICVIIWPACAFLFALIYGIRGKYEGQDIEDKYGVEAWYRTF